MGTYGVSASLEEEKSLPNLNTTDGKSQSRRTEDEASVFSLFRVALIRFPNPSAEERSNKRASSKRSSPLTL